MSLHMHCFWQCLARWSCLIPIKLQLTESLMGLIDINWELWAFWILKKRSVLQFRPYRDVITLPVYDETKHVLRQDPCAKRHNVVNESWIVIEIQELMSMSRRHEPSAFVLQFCVVQGDMWLVASYELASGERCTRFVYDNRPILMYTAKNRTRVSCS